MSAIFPYVDPFTRLENALWGVFHCRGNKSLAIALTSLWEIWSLHAELRHRLLTSRSTLLKVVVLRILRAVSPECSLPVDQLHTLLQLLHSIVTGSILLHQFTKQLDGRKIIDQVQCRFSEFTSGWKLCADLCGVLSCPLIVCQEFVIGGLDFSAPHGLSVVDEASVKYSTDKSAVRSEVKRARYQSAIAKDIIHEGKANTGEKFKLKTLEEHRYATRFQEKRVTPKTWRTALQEAHKLIRTGDRVHLADALYLLLEIIWLDPRGSNLAALYLDSGSIYLVFDHLEEAVKAYRNSLRLDSSNWTARYNLGIATARMQDFVEATRQLKLSLKECPVDIAEEVDKILKEIDGIQSSKNLRAFHETKKDRVFTTQYLESQHLASGSIRNSSRPNLQEDYTVTHRNGLALNSSTPQLLDVATEWQGILASLLHRLHGYAFCRHFNIKDEMLRLDRSRPGGISFDQVVMQITGSPLRETERKELNCMLGNDGTILFHLLAPNAESTIAFEEIQTQGACHALLDWNLYRKRAKRSTNSRAGGLWYWFGLTMAKWIEGILPLQNATDTSSSLIETLLEHGWLTPMDFAWKWRCLPEPDKLTMLHLANRGVFIYECHHARTCIQEEATRTLQMFLRRYLIKAKLRKNAVLFGSHPSCYERIAHGQVPYLEDVHTRLADDTLFDQQVARDVLQCLEDMVDELVISTRQKQKTSEVKVWEEIPVRTERRQNFASGMD